jgi:serine/threonine protein kinase
MHSHTDPSENLDLLVTRVGLAENLPVFNRFRLRRILGRGGMGVVWLAKDEKSGRDVAMKFMPDIVAGNTSALQDMRRETRNGMKLSHQNVVTMYDLVEENESAAIVMEYVKGTNLDIMRRSQPGQIFEAAVLRPYVMQLLDALEYAHSVANMVHRDLKPANLMVDEHDVLKVADFGIARNLKDTVSRISMKLNGAGTLSYMSPQQMMGDNPTAADDIYALGATLYELLTGKPPFHTGDIATQVESRVPPRMSDRRQEFGVRGEPIPDVWETVVAACLEKQPLDRPANIGEIRQGLLGQKFKRGTGQTTSRRATPGRKGSASAGGLSMTKLAAAAAVLIGIAGFYSGSKPASDKDKDKDKSGAGLFDQTAKFDLKSCQEQVAKVKAVPVKDFDSAYERRDAWNKITSTLKLLAMPGDKAWDDLISEAVYEETRASREEVKERKKHEAAVAKLEEDKKRALTESARPDLNASAKKQLWESFLAKIEAEKPNMNSVYGTEDTSLELDATAEFNRFEAEMMKESAVTFATGTAVLTADTTRSWGEHEKKEMIRRVQEELQKADLYQGKIDGQQGAQLHQALIAYQKKEQMPTTARIDEAVLDHLKVDKARPAQAVAGNKSSGSGNGTSYRQPTSETSGGSNVARTITDWATAGSALRRFRGGGF